MIQIKGPRVPRSRGPIITTQGGTPTPGKTGDGDTVAAFELRVSHVYQRLVDAFQEPGEPIDIDLDRDLARGLWLAILHDGVLANYSGSLEDLRADLRGKRTLLLTWDFRDGDAETLWAFITADGVPIADGEFDHFLDEGRWNAAALRWLIGQLGVEDPTLRKTVREALPRERKH
jgi:hypothetical protein